MKGSYEIIGSEKLSELKDSSVVSGYVYDIKTKSTIKGAVVQIQEIAKGIFTDAKGYFQFVIPSGSYTVKASNAGNTEVLTEKLTFTPSHKVEITFNLGVNIMYEYSTKK